MEVLTGDSLTGKLRMPTVSLTQKTHNVEISLKALEASAAGRPPGNMTAKDIVQGHREKTLELVWHIIFGFGQMNKDILSETKLEKEISFLQKSLDFRVQIQDRGKSSQEFRGCERKIFYDTNVPRHF